jgi:hypothetical protein
MQRTFRASGAYLRYLGMEVSMYELQAQCANFSLIDKGREFRCPSVVLLVGFARMQVYGGGREIESLSI